LIYAIKIESSRARFADHLETHHHIVPADFFIADICSTRNLTTTGQAGSSLAAGCVREGSKGANY
jgi:uncharacterized RmlC-like cupin family protein